MHAAIIVSEKDPAGINVYDHLIRKKIPGPINISIHKIKTESIYAENIDKKIKSDIIIFATKHVSKSKKPTLSVHTPGNFSKAQFGGYDKELCICLPGLMKESLILLDKKSQDTIYEATLEATHHGPYIKTPCMFIEIGSSKEQWKDNKAGKIVSETIIEVLSGYEIDKYRTAVGFGGNHYCANFNKIMLETEYAVGHICAKYNFKNLNKDLVDQMLKRSYSKNPEILLDWKGLGGQKQKLLNLLKELNLDWKKSKEIR
ncbi:D-tyrosyl-tRNA(Tyr) deacylase [Candidatus Woesearchaeota archaeon]|nr:D-tyrosyl-tRNA(Tyr) deacylase [Candidatus Woesearchaeota archaeon]